MLMRAPKFQKLGPDWTLDARTFSKQAPTLRELPSPPWRFVSSGEGVCVGGGG